MKEFMLIFRHPDGSKLASPEQMQIWMKQTMDWLAGIAAQNKLVNQGKGLSFEESRVVRQLNLLKVVPFCRGRATVLKLERLSHRMVFTETEKQVIQRKIDQL